MLTALRLDEFLDRLESLAGPLSLETMERELQALAPEEILALARFHPERYERNTLRRTAHFEALVMGWRSGQCSSIHNHSGSACGYLVVQGRATELLFERSPAGLLFPCGTEVHEVGQVIASVDDDIHQVCNLEAPGQDLVSLHIYSPPLSGAQSFSVQETPFRNLT